MKMVTWWTCPKHKTTGVSILEAESINTMQCDIYAFALMKLCCGDNRFPVEEGQQQNLPKGKQNMYEVHFFLVCSWISFSFWTPSMHRLSCKNLPCIHDCHAKLFSFFKQNFLNHPQCTVIVDWHFTCVNGINYRYALNIFIHVA